MRRYRQTVDELLGALSAIQTSWRDEHSKAVLQLIEAIPQKRSYRTEDIATILDRDFQAGLTALRLVLELSKDEFTAALQTHLGPGGTGPTRNPSVSSAFTSASTFLRSRPASAASWRSEDG